MKLIQVKLHRTELLSPAALSLDCKRRLFWMTGGVLQRDEFGKILKDLVFGEFFPDRRR